MKKTMTMISEIQIIVTNLKFHLQFFYFMIIFKSIMIQNHSVVLSQSDSMDCIFNPSLRSCADYNLPKQKIEPMLDDLCINRPNLLGCSLRKLCKVDNKINGTKTCHPFSLLTDICAEDSPRMRGCKTYIQLCRPESVVRQCANYANLPGFTSTMDTLDKIHTLCASPELKGSKDCLECLGNLSICEPLITYTALCKKAKNDLASSFFSYPRALYSQQSPRKQVPYIFENDDDSVVTRICKPWDNLCTQVAPESISLCGYQKPRFRPWLHWDNRDYVLFDFLSMMEWAGWISGWVVPFLIGLLFESHKLVRKWFKKSLKAEFCLLAASSGVILQQEELEREPLIPSSQEHQQLGETADLNEQSSNQYTYISLAKRVRFALKSKFLLGISSFFHTLLLVLLILTVATFNIKLIVSCLLGIVSSHILLSHS